MSIGLAVYNGEEFLAEAIDSILAQTFTDFELIISDNASTDRTAEIAKEYAARDPRIRYSRNDTNIGGANNENLTVELATGTYFRLAAHDDVCAPTLLEKCLAALEANPDAVLAYTKIVAIDGHGDVMHETWLRRGLSARPSTRFRELAFKDHSCEPTYGLMRLETLRRTRLQENYVNSDRALLCELALMGRFVEIPEPLFFKRFHAKNVYVDTRARLAWFNPDWKGKVSFPNWRLLQGYVSVIRAAPIPRGEKLRCAATLVHWTLRYAHQLAKDLVVGVLMFLTPKARRFRNRHVYNWE
jgi:glycosyltransferase involved in cell wall biosynthesis